MTTSSTQVKPQFELTPSQRASLASYGYIVENLIMDGSSCSVFKVRKKSIALALKNIDSNHIGATKVRREILMVQRATHEFIVKTIEVLELGSNFMLIFEYAPRGDMISLIERSSAPFPVELSQMWFKQIILAMIHLRLLNIAHRDLKADNILVFDDRVKLADFGHACEAADSNCEIIMLKDFCGTYEYNAPETLLFNETYNGFLADIFMLGVLLNVMTTLEFPYEAEPNNQKYRDKIMKKHRHYAEVLKGDNLLLNLIDGMLEPFPGKRMTLLQILDHPWMGGVEIGDYSLLASKLWN